MSDLVKAVAGRFRSDATYRVSVVLTALSALATLALVLI
jgi:hypothetical protein